MPYARQFDQGLHCGFQKSIDAVEYNTDKWMHKLSWALAICIKALFSCYTIIP